MFLLIKSEREFIKILFVHLSVVIILFFSLLYFGSMGSNNSSSSTSSSSTTTDKNSDCYLRNRIIRQQCLQTRPDNASINPKPNLGNLNPSTQQSTICSSKIQIGCDCQGNVVECDENGRILRTIKQNNR